VKQTGKMTGLGKQKKPATGLETLFEIALTETKQLKIATKRSQIQTLNSYASGSGDGVDILSKVPDEQVHEKTVTVMMMMKMMMLTKIQMHMMMMMQQNQIMIVTTLLMSTFSIDDQEENNDEEEQDEDDEDDEEISDQLVRTPSNYQTSDESEKHKDDDRVKDGEEDKEGDVMNVNLEGGDVDITEVDTTKYMEDAH
ncbi:hypothetical protein Tco_1358541, partial [Tanacetum coccineum]